MASVQNKREEKSKREVKALHIYENGAMQWPDRMWTGPQTPEDYQKPWSSREEPPENAGRQLNIF